MLDDDTLKCAICFDLCVRPVTVRRMAGCTGLSEAVWERRGGHALVCRAATARSRPPPPPPPPPPPTPPRVHAGPLPAQLLPQVLPGPGEQVQQGLPLLPPRVWRQVCRKPSHQHRAHRRHPRVQGGRCAPLGARVQQVCWRLLPQRLLHGCQPHQLLLPPLLPRGLRALPGPHPCPPFGRLLRTPGSTTTTGQRRRSPRSVLCALGGPMPHQGASWSTCPTTTLAPSPPLPTPAARCADPYSAAAPPLPPACARSSGSSQGTCRPAAAQAPRARNAHCLLLPPCPALLLPPCVTRRASAWASGGRTGWTAASGAPTFPTSPALPASPTLAHSQWCCLAGEGAAAGVGVRMWGGACALAAAVSPPSSARAAASAPPLPPPHPPPHTHTTHTHAHTATRTTATRGSGSFIPALADATCRATSAPTRSSRSTKSLTP